MLYTVGFLFNPTLSYIALIEKTRPPWQAGSLNGIGGKREGGETSLECQCREFEEETGVAVTTWRNIGNIEGPEVYDAQRALKHPDFHVTVFAAVATGEQWNRLESKTDEEVKKLLVSYVLDDKGYCKCIPNLKWLIPMAAQSLMGVYGETKFRVIEHA